MPVLLSAIRQNSDSEGIIFVIKSPNMRIIIIILVGFLTVLVSCEKENDPQLNNPPDNNKPPTGTVKGSITVIHDIFQNRPIVLAGKQSANFIVSFYNDSNLTFTGFNALPVIMKDNEGNEWDVFGEAISGPRQGERLSPTESYMAYWFALASFFPPVEIYNDNSIIDYTPETLPDEEWLVNTNYLYAGALKDAIPSLEAPDIIRFRLQDYNDYSVYVTDEDLVAGIKVDSTAIAFPYSVLTWHEIVNYQVDGINYTLSYCPLTGSSVCWDRTIDGNVTTFGVSGLLYNNNLIMYDRNTESFWSQMRQEIVHGELIGSKPVIYQVVETTLRTWRSMYPETWILTNNTGHNRDYGMNPYGDYAISNNYILFPFSFDDPRIPRKEKIHAIIMGGHAKVYRLVEF